MTAFALYLLKVCICSGVLFGYYHLFLQNKLFHQWNRFFLLFSVVLSLALPFVEFDVPQPQTTADTIQLFLIGQSADNYLEEFVVSNERQWSTEKLVGTAYLSISLVFIFLLIHSILRIFSIVRSHTVKLFQNIKFVNTDDRGAPFSFFNYIFWKQDISLQTEVGQQIFQHELVHVSEKHTWDKLFMQTVIAIFWCNPFFWLMRKELKFIHEFIADRKAVGDAGTEAFAAMILQTVYPQQFQTITNQFFHTPIKRRIFMLTQVKNQKVAYASRVVALPMVALLIFSFSVRTKHFAELKAPIGINHPAATDTIPKKTREVVSVDVNSTKKLITITYTDGSVETMTERQATEKGLINNDYSNRKDSARVQGVQSNIRLRSQEPSPLYIVDGDEVGKEVIEKLDPKRIESINVLKGASATAVYGEKGKNGVVLIKTKSVPANEPISLQGNGNNATVGQPTGGEPSNDKISGDMKEITVVGYKKEKSNASDPVFEKAEFMPTVDRDEWRAFLEKYTTNFIKEATAKGIPAGKYTVLVRFLVEKDGSVSESSILTDPGYGLGNNVLGMMKHAPRWKPAIQNQRVVRSYQTQPITFIIDEGEKDTAPKKRPISNATTRS